MPITSSSITDDRAAALLCVAAYLSRPQEFMAVADARAEMRRTLDLAEKGSVVLTTEDSYLRSLGDEYEGVLILSWNEFRDHLRGLGLLIAKLDFIHSSSVTERVRQAV
ncbi:MAG TPA: hypothetical protein VK619_17030 [Pyrinomonadaceae bacterium]|nr:hypothetical protein [Pyrinomonadaceae bacterium]